MSLVSQWPSVFFLPDAGAKPKLSSLSSQAVASCSSSSTSLHSIASTSSSVSKVVPVTELPLDVQLAKEEGKIKGKRNEMLWVVFPA